MSQLADSLITGPLVLQTVPSEKAAALIFVCGLGWLEWVEITGTGAFRGYRTLRCGALEWGTTLAPRAYEADLVGGLGSKTSQASIWAWAQQNGHAVASAAWTTRVFKFADVDANTFRFPDLRGIFVRFTGTDADTGAVVPIGAYKEDTIKSHQHASGAGGFIGGQYAGGGAPTGYSATGATGTAETAPKHTSFAPRIHI